MTVKKGGQYVIEMMPKILIREESQFIQKMENFSKRSAKIFKLSMGATLVNALDIATHKIQDHTQKKLDLFKEQAQTSLNKLKTIETESDELFANDFETPLSHFQHKISKTDFNKFLKAVIAIQSTQDKDKQRVMKTHFFGESSSKKFTDFLHSNPTIIKNLAKELGFINSKAPFIDKANEIKSVSDFKEKLALSKIKQELQSQHIIARQIQKNPTTLEKNILQQNKEQLLELQKTNAYLNNLLQAEKTAQAVRDNISKMFHKFSDIIVDFIGWVKKSWITLEKLLKKIPVVGKWF